MSVLTLKTDTEKRAFLGGVTSCIFHLFAEKGMLKNANNELRMSAESECIELVNTCIDANMYADLFITILACHILTTKEIKQLYFAFVVSHFDTEILEQTKEIYTEYKTQKILGFSSNN